MASSYLGPESPRPLSVISERYRHFFQIPEYPRDERYSFGEEHEEGMYGLLHRHLELGTTDRLCYVGDVKGSLVSMVTSRFCLLEPVVTIVPGHFSFVQTSCRKSLPIRVDHVGCEEYFLKAVQSPPEERPVFDKVILYDIARFLTNPKECYQNILECLADHGRMLVLHRAAAVNTLPYCRDAKQRLEETDVDPLAILNDLQSCKLDVTWDIECLPVVMAKRKWFAMLRDRFPTQAEVLSDTEVADSSRMLAEGIMKYEGEMVEFTDRLLVITAVKSLMENGLPVVERHGGNSCAPSPEDRKITYAMTVTPEIRQIIKEKEEERKKKKNTNRWETVRRDR